MSRLDHGLAVIVSTLFLLAYGLACFRVPWGWDLLRHAAAVRAFQLDLGSPPHEAMGGVGSVMHTPYNLLYALVGLAGGLTPYRSLQVAGLVNLALYLAGLFLFFRRFSLLPTSWLPPVLALLLSLFFRQRIYGWSSETDFSTLRYIPAYPSFLGWGAALSSLGLARGFLRAGRWVALAAAAGLLALLLVSHPLSGGWLLGLLGVLSVWTLAAERHARRPLLLLGALALALLAALAWPYPPGLLGLTRYAGFTEGAPFAERPFADMPLVYGLGGLALLYLALVRRRPALLILWTGTLIGLFGLTALGVSFGSRFVFFQLFFVHAALAEVLALAVCSYWPAVFGGAPSPPLSRGPALALLAAGLVIVPWVASPWLRSPAHRWPPLGALLSAPASEALHYARLRPFAPHLSSADLVLTEPNAQAYSLAEVTGARVFLAITAFDHPDYLTREPLGRAFFAQTSSGAEAALLGAGVTKLLLSAASEPIRARLRVRCGPPLAASEELELFALRPCVGR